MARKKQQKESEDLDCDDDIELEDVEQYELITPRHDDGCTKRRRIEELMEERALQYSIYGDVGW